MEAEKGYGQNSVRMKGSSIVRSIRCPAGEQTKVMLAVLFQREGNFLLIDEPTNHLDQESRTLVSAYLRRQKGFLMSHDRAFLDGCIDHVLAFNRSDIEVQKRGLFSSWYQNRQMQGYV